MVSLQGAAHWSRFRSRRWAPQGGFSVKHLLNTFLLALLVALSASGAPKTTGLANESGPRFERIQHFAGVVGRSSTYGTNTNSSATAVYAVYQTC